jgi:hypothetical protein
MRSIHAILIALALAAAPALAQQPTDLQPLPAIPATATPKWLLSTRALPNPS